MADCKALIDKLLDPDVKAFFEKIEAVEADGVPPARAQIAAVDALIQEAWDDRAILIAQIQEEHPGLINEVGTFLADAPITPVQDSFPGLGAPPPTAAPVERRAPPVLTGPYRSQADKAADTVERERVASIAQVPIDRAERKLTKAERKRKGREKAGAAPVVPTPTEETTPATTEAPALPKLKREDVFPTPPGEHVGVILRSNDLGDVVTDYLIQVRALLVAANDAEVMQQYEAILAGADVTPIRAIFSDIAKLMDDAQFNFLGQDLGATPEIRDAQDIYGSQAGHLMNAAPRIAEVIVETLQSETGLAAVLEGPKDASQDGSKKRSAAEVLKKKQPKRVSKTGKGAAAIKTAAKTRKTKAKRASGKLKRSAAKEDKKESKPPVADKPQQADRKRKRAASVEEVPLAASQPEYLTILKQLEGQELGIDDILNTEVRTTQQSLNIFVALASTGAAENGAKFRMGAQGIMQMAFFREGGKTKAWEQARDYVSGKKALLYDSVENAATTDDVFVSLVTDTDHLPNPKYTVKGEVKDWAAHGLQRSLLARIHMLAVHAPADPTAEMEVQIGTTANINTEVVNLAASKTANKKSTAAGKLIDVLSELEDKVANDPAGLGIVSDEKIFIDAQIATIIADLKPDLTQLYRGVPLSEWLPKGKLAWESRGSKNQFFIPVTGMKTIEAEASTNAILKDADAKPIAGKASRLEGDRITKPMGLGAVKLAVKAFRAKLNERVRPRILEYKNVAEFKKKKPDLYNEAMTSRQDKAPIPDNAAGYAFGNTVLVFSDNIKSKQHLTFVLAHEVIGHFGLAAIMPNANRIKLMDQIYDVDANIRTEADRRMEAFGVDRQEATEDALADLAGDIESSTIMRVWDAIKRFLARIGFQPQDEMARYFVYQSRRYARTGSTGDVSAQAIYNNLIALQDRFVEGKAAESHLSGTAQAQHTVLRGADAITGGFERILRAITRTHTLEGAKENTLGVANMVKNGLEIIQTLDQKALRSEGLRKLFDIFRLQTEHVRELQTQLNDLTDFSTRARWPWLTEPENSDDTRGGVKGLDKKEKAQLNRLLELAAIYKSQTVTEKTITDTDPIIVFDDAGNPTLNEASVKKLKALGAVSQEEFEAGLGVQVIDDEGNPVWEDAEKTIPVTLPHEIDFKITGRVWQSYQEQREAVETIALQVHLDKILGMIETKDVALKDMQFDNSTLEKDDLDIIAEITEVYSKRYDKGAKLEGAGLKWDAKEIASAQLMLREIMRAFHEKFKVKDWVEGNTKPREDGKLEASEQFRKDKDLQGIIAKLAQLNSRGINEKNAAAIERTIKDMHLLDSQVTNSEFYAKRTVLGAYVPFVRRGKLQVRVQAFDESGKAIKLDESVEAMLFYARTDNDSTANDMVRDLNKIFGEKGAIEVMTRKDGVLPVTLVAEKSFALKTPPLGGSVSYDELAQTLVRLGINLTPQERERLVTMTAKQHSSARSNLLRSGNPGWDPNITRGVAEHLETQTHIAGKNRFKHRTADVMADRRGVLWSGDKERLDKLQAAYLLARKGSNEALKFETYKAMASYQHMYLNSSSRTGIKLIKEDGTEKIKDGLHRGNVYRDDALALVEYYNSTGNIADATGEEKFGKQAAFFMSGTAALQLGGALAPALINMSSLASHAIPYLATLNKKTGYGGGHGMGAASRAIRKAMSNLSLIKGGLFLDETGSAKEIQKIIDSGRLAEFGLEKDEAEFLLGMTQKGVLTPNMFNALIGTSRTGKQDVRGRVVEKWMLMFSKTEQYNRRVTALASYRLEKARMMARGVPASEFNNATSEASQTALDRSVLAVNASQGNYSQFNRPAIARGNIFQYLFMYKQFVLITVQLMRNLGTKERAMFLAFLVFASGLKGLPFAEDFLDIADTLAQKFGIKMVGLEIEIAKLADAVVPGSAPILLRGILDYSLGATFSTRLGHGDLIPGTSMFMAGADTGREALGILGPVASAVTGVLGTGALIAQFLAESVGLRPDVTTLTDIGRAGFASSLVKSFTDGLVFAADGNITNQRGQVISKSAGVHQVIWRMMGFYPGNATTHNDVVRMGKRATEHAKEIKTSFIDAYIKGDREERREIKRDVREWNKDAKGTPFFITNFAESARKAVASAKLTTTGRFVKAAPKQIRRTLLNELLPIYGFSTKGVPVGDN